ncbi:MAG: hypothetical protein Q4C49_00980 [Bacillota bacterium]|nr:hypothetical protein [Bacillota bacterium]
MNSLQITKSFVIGVAFGAIVTALMVVALQPPKSHCYEEIVTSVEVDSLPSGMYRIHYHK